MIERIRPGDRKIPAASWNAMADALDNTQPSGILPGTARNPSLILVKNASGEHVPAFGVLRITGRLFPVLNDHLVGVNQMLNGGVELTGETPNDDDEQIIKAPHTREEEINYSGTAIRAIRVVYTTTLGGSGREQLRRTRHIESD